MLVLLLVVGPLFYDFHKKKIAKEPVIINSEVVTFKHKKLKIKTINKRGDIKPITIGTFRLDRDYKKGDTINAEVILPRINRPLSKHKVFVAYHSPIALVGYCYEFYHLGNFNFNGGFSTVGPLVGIGYSLDPNVDFYIGTDGEFTFGFNIRL